MKLGKGHIIALLNLGVGATGSAALKGEVATLLEAEGLIKRVDKKGEEWEATSLGQAHCQQIMTVPKPTVAYVDHAGRICGRG